MSPFFDDPFFDSVRKWVLPAGPKEGRDPVGVSRAFVALRRRVLAESPADLGLAPSERLPRVWAVLVDYAAGANVVTVTCVADGTTSLYSGVGGGIVGAGSVPAVAAAAGSLLDVAERVLDALPAADKVALPPVGSVAFLVMTYGGMHRIEVPEAEVMEVAAGSVHELYVATGDVVTELRRADAAG